MRNESMTRKLVGVCLGILSFSLELSKAATADSPVIVHRRIGLTQCELEQRGSLTVGTDFASLEVEGDKHEIYSPEMGPADWLSVSSPISKPTAKNVRKSGFDLREEPAPSANLPSVRPLDGAAACPDVQSAIAEVGKTQEQRRAEVQGRVYRAGVNDIIAPTPVKDPLSKADTRSPPDKPSKAGKKFEGTVILNVLVGTDGAVQQSKVVRSVNPDLDKQASEEVARWKFTPATKKGLPVPSVVPIEIHFSLYR